MTRRDFPNNQMLLKYFYNCEETTHLQKDDQDVSRKMDF